MAILTAEIRGNLWSLISSLFLQSEASPTRGGLLSTEIAERVALVSAPEKDASLGYIFQKRPVTKQREVCTGNRGNVQTRQTFQQELRYRHATRRTVRVSVSIGWINAKIRLNPG